MLTLECRDFYELSFAISHSYKAYLACEVMVILQSVYQLACPSNNLCNLSERQDMAPNLFRTYEPSMHSALPYSESFGLRRSTEAPWGEKGEVITVMSSLISLASRQLIDVYTSSRLWLIWVGLWFFSFSSTPKFNHLLLVTRSTSWSTIL